MGYGTVLVMEQKPKTQKPKPMWAIFNYGTILGVRHRHRDIIQEAMRLFGSRAEYDRYCKDGTIRISKVLVSEVV